MYPYIALFIVSSLFGYKWERSRGRLKSVLEFLLYFYLFLFIGLKDGVGTDSNNYEFIYNRVLNEIGILLKYPEVSFYLINNISAYYEGGTVLVYLACGALFSLFTWLAAREFEINPCYFFALVMPFHLVMLGISGVRQGVAESIVIYAIALLWNEKRNKYLVFVVFATTFHASALFFASFAFIGRSKKLFLIALVVMVPALLVFADTRYGHYARYDLFSQGVLLRVGYLSLPVIAFIYTRKEIARQGLTVSRMFLVSIWIFPLLASLSTVSTTLVDRVAYDKLFASTLFASLVCLLLFCFKGNNAHNYAYSSILVAGVEIVQPVPQDQLPILESEPVEPESELVEVAAPKIFDAEIIAPEVIATVPSKPVPVEEQPVPAAKILVIAPVTNNSVRLSQFDQIPEHRVVASKAITPRLEERPGTVVISTAVKDPDVTG